MKKQEFDTIENVFCVKQIPNKEDVNAPENKDWWGTTYHSTDEEAKRPEMFKHAIAFDGTCPVVVRDINKGTQVHYTASHFTSTYKQRK